ncbi:MAG: nucleotidyltransferase family protein [Chloroflexi bacterium]|nr:nucleotidyltransferase family protein [Chloroflexota bacterium]
MRGWRSSPPASATTPSEPWEQRDEVLRLLAEHRVELAAMGVGALSLFGSVARDEAGPTSDIDLLIDLGRQLDLFDLGRIQMRLEAILGAKVDLVMADALRPCLRAVILREAIHATILREAIHATYCPARGRGTVTRLRAE